MKGMCFAELSGSHSRSYEIVVDLLWSFLTLPGSECGECCTVHASVQLREDHYIAGPYIRVFTFKILTTYH